ncbi:MAG TPA: potassium transporter TrkA [Euryarchaeota archaeon]|nr:putative manganese-dependent inorganic pyrophosphatase [archaeon BMS3Bbin15]HDL16107.1 potassium transporter TrkA [Euryarchaeota archaeon]
MHAVLGCGTSGYFAAEKLKESKKDIIIVDNDKTRVESLKERGFSTVIQGDITDIKTLKAAGVANVEAALILTTDLELNLKAARAVKDLNDTVAIVVRAKKDSTSEDFKDMDIDLVIYPSYVVAEKAIESLKELELRRRLKHLKKVIKDAGEKALAIVLQDNPDPDAIASGMSLKRIAETLNIQSDLIYGGEIGHEENKALVNLLGLTLIPSVKVRDIRDYGKIALIESSVPGVNNFLPKGTRIDIIIDHHPFDDKINVEYWDIRPELGAASTILTEYFVSLDIDITEDLATALLYGIKTDTNNFTRATTSDDLKAVAMLYPKASQELLIKIETPLMSTETLDILSEAIRNRKIKGSFLLSNVGFIRDRDTLPQAAEYLLNLEGISTVLVYGIGKNVIYLSGRNKDIRINLGDIMNNAFGNIGQAGGHATAAAAKISLGLFGIVKDKTSLLKLVEEAISSRFFEAVGIEEKSD